MIILIHTSVKLVTFQKVFFIGSKFHFNPHEREARDYDAIGCIGIYGGILIHTSVKLVTCRRTGKKRWIGILIHTSVKLVTGRK